MAKVAKPVAVMDVELDDGMAFWMGDGAYLAVQHDEYGRRHAVLLSAEALAVIASVEHGRGRKTIPMSGGGFARVLEARTALKSLWGRVGAGRAARACGDSLRSLAGLSAA